MAATGVIYTQAFEPCYPARCVTCSINVDVPVLSK